MPAIWDILNGAYFYPRSPCGERLDHGIALVPHQQISIHALLAESDKAGYYKILPRPDFYPRSPCGERRVTDCIPVQQATISIHALLAESDACITIISICTA